MGETLSETLLAARDKLEQARLQLHDEIVNYPTPIAGCDAQFNHFLSERQKVLNALSALNSDVHVPTPRTP